MRDRGHDVLVLANPVYGELVGNSGLTFVPVGDAEEMVSLRKNPKSLNYDDGWKLWLKHCAIMPMRALHQTILELCQPHPHNTVVVANYLSFGARIAQDQIGIPLATVHMDAHTIRTREEVLAMPFPSIVGSWVPRWFHDIQFWTTDTFWIDPLVRPQINAFRQELGLPHIRRIAHHWWHSPDLTIGLYPEWWNARRADWPQQCVRSDFIFWDDGDEEGLSVDVQNFLQAGPRPIAFTPGTSSMHTTEYFTAAITACQSLNLRGILVTDRADLVPALPNSMRVFPYIPFGPLLSELAMVVHHGGVGTSARCMAAALPQVVVPTLYNQPDTAKRLERLGIARSISPRQLTPARMTAAIRDLLPFVVNNWRPG